MNLTELSKFAELKSAEIFAKLSKCGEQIFLLFLQTVKVNKTKNSAEFFTKLSKYTESKSAENTYTVSPAGAQRGGGFTQAGASVRLGRE